jgi:predicted ATPase
MCIRDRDNFEHLLGPGGASLLPDMLQATSRLKILATSRLRLNLREEHLYPLSGMPYPSDPAQVQEADPWNYPAGQLFLASARRVRPDFGLLPGESVILAAICQKLEGMPLALELAAAWADSLSLAGIAAELGGGIDILASGLTDLPERHRSVRSTLDATWRLLQPAERQAFTGLCVFRGGFSREAAEQVANAALPMLAQLISKSLVEFDPVSERYRVHEVLRQYGEEKLAGAGLLAETRQRHLEYLKALAERASDGLFGPDQIAWLDRLQAEQDNFRAALAWGFTRPETTGETADLVIALSWFWRMRSHVLEGREWLDRTLLQPGLTNTQRAAALYHGGHLAWMQDDFELARRREEESLALWRSMGSAGRRGEAYATHSLGMALYGSELRAQNDLEPAVGAFRTCLDLMRQVGDEWGAAFALQWLAFSLTSQGETEPAIAAAQESLASYRRLGEAWGTGLVLGALANLSLQTGDLAQARQYAESAQEWRARVGHRHSLGVGYELLATIAEREDRVHAAAANYRQAATIFDSLGNQPYAEKMRDRLAALLAKQVSAPS